MLSTNKIDLAIPFHGVVVMVEAEGPFQNPTFKILGIVDFDLTEFQKFLHDDSDFCLEVASQFREKFLVRSMANECFLERGFEA